MHGPYDPHGEGILELRTLLRQAEKLLQRALAIEEQALGARHPALINTIENYAIVLRVLRRHEEAAQLEDRASRLRAEL